MTLLSMVFSSVDSHRLLLNIIELLLKLRLYIDDAAGLQYVSCMIISYRTVRRIGQSGKRKILRNAQFLDHECRRSCLDEDLFINLGASAKECRNKRLH